MESNEKNPSPSQSDCDRSRQQILGAAARLAAVDGLGRLSVEGLADHFGMRKGLLHKHFASDEKLQLSTIQAVKELYDREIVEPALGRPDPLSRLSALCENYLLSVERSAGGCFFASASAEFDTRPGRARDLLVQINADWLDRLKGLAAQAQGMGLIREDEDPTQLAFELNSLLYNANGAFVLHQNPDFISRARRALARRLRAAASPLPD